MKKVQRLNSKKGTGRKIRRTRATNARQVISSYPDDLIGRKIKLKTLPKVKRAKRLFEVGTEYEVVKPKANFRNTLMAVNIKGSDGKTYYIQFPHWALLPN